MNVETEIEFIKNELSELILLERREQISKNKKIKENKILTINLILS